MGRGPGHFLHHLHGSIRQAGSGQAGEEQVTEINSRAEKDHFKIKRFAILYKLLDMDDGELTKTGKIRRKFVREKYQNLYDALYDESVSEKEVEAFFQYQDGQSTTFKTKISFYTMEGF
jgi:long-chain acyl-CoA synthetase